MLDFPVDEILFLLALFGLGLLLIVPIAALVLLVRIRREQDYGVYDLKRELRGLRQDVKTLLGLVEQPGKEEPERKPEPAPAPEETIEPTEPPVEPAVEGPPEPIFPTPSPLEPPRETPEPPWVEIEFPRRPEPAAAMSPAASRSEEHTSELQSH